jgi:hypothetical protein
MSLEDSTRGEGEAYLIHETLCRGGSRTAPTYDL